MTTHDVEAAVGRAHREEWPRVVGAMMRVFGDLDVAEEAAAEAFATAVERWRTDGVPPNPGGWLTTTARRKAIDRMRREHRRDERHRAAAALRDDRPATEDDGIEDERLRLVLTCCHPALPLDSRVALTLRMVAGLTVAEIASAFLVRDTTMGQRISRAKARIRTQAVPYRLPSEEDLPERVDGVLAVLYLVFNEGYLSSSADAPPVREALSGEAIRLARLVRDLMPAHAETSGLLALMLLTESRRRARVSPEGTLITLGEQDRSTWDTAMVAEGRDVLADAFAAPAPGRYAILAAIGATHAAAARAAETDWRRIVALYDLLARIDPSPIVALNRAVAVAEVDGPEVALALVDALRDPLSGYHAAAAVRADLLRRLGRTDEARRAYDEAIGLTANRAERAYLADRRDESASAGAPPPPLQRDG